MIKRPLKLLLKTIAILFIVTGLVTAAGFWRLSKGPVSLSFLVGTLENFINENVDGLTVSFDDVVLEKDKNSGALQFRFIDLNVRDADNKLVARTSRAGFRISARDLLGGELSPTHLELLGPKMFLHRQMDGSFRLGFGNLETRGKPVSPAQGSSSSGTDAGKSSGTSDITGSGSYGGPENAEDMIALLQATLLSDNNKGPTARLREIRIINASLTLYDEPNATTWNSPQADITMLRTKDGLTADVIARIKVGRESFNVNVQAAYKKSSRNITVDVSVRDVKPETLARHVPDLQMLKFLHFPVSGSASAKVALDGKILNASIDIKLGAGNLVFDEKQIGEIGVKSGNITANYDQKKRLLVIEPSVIDLSGGKASLSGYLTPEGDSGNPFSLFEYNLELDNIKIVGKKTIEIDRIFAIGSADSDKAIINLETAELHAGGGLISVNGTIRAKGNTPDFRLSGNIENISTTKLLEIWPLEVGRGLRTWIDENLIAFVPGGSFKVDIDGQDIANLIDGSKVPKNFLQAEFEVKDATISYLDGLPPLKRAYGKGVLKDGNFDFFAKGGVATVASGKKVQLTKAHFNTNWAISDPAIGKVDVSVKGSASAVMELLNNNPLNFAGKMGVNPKTIGGKVVGDLVFTMPLVADLPLEKVDIKARAKLTGIKIPKAFGEFDISKGNLILDITKFGLKGTGTLNLKGTRASLVWTENFGVRGKRSSEFRMKASVDDAARKRMGIDLSTFMRGPAAVTFTLKGSGVNVNEAHLQADLTKATLFRNRIGWISPPGEKTSASLDMKFIKGGAIDIRNIEVASKKRNVLVTGNLSLSATGEVLKFNLPKILLGALNQYSASAKRNSKGGLDVLVRGISFDARPLIANALGRDRKAPVPLKNKARDTIRLSARFDKVYAHNKQVFTNFASQLTNIGSRAIEIQAIATISGTKAFSFNYGEKAGTPYNLVISSEDAGSTLKAFDLYSKIQQGRLVLRARLSPPGSDAPSTGTLKIKQFDIANDDRLKGLTQTVVKDDEQIEAIFRDSVSFTSFKMPFKLYSDRLEIGNSILKGAVLGASGRGVINTRTNALNIEGTLIPIYAVNSIVGKIPVLGRILVGRKGEGVFGVTFSLRGTTSKPEFSINPVSVLAPGFLRQFFEKGTQDTTVRKTKKSAPTPLQPKAKIKKPPAVVAEPGGN